MIPGVIAQTLKRPPPPAHVNIFVSSRQTVTSIQNVGFGKAITLRVSTAIALNRTKPVTKTISAQIGQLHSVAPHLAELLSAKIGQSVALLRTITATISVSLNQRHKAPQTQPGNLRATQAALQVLEKTADPTNLRATQAALQVLEKTADPTNLRATQVTVQVLRTQA
jgi:hypothetical protein